MAKVVDAQPTVSADRHAPSRSLYRAALLSDGASRLIDPFQLATWEELLALLDENDPDELLRQARAAEAVDPEGRQWPRTKRSDDATAVYLQRCTSSLGRAASSPRGQSLVLRPCPGWRDPADGAGMLDPQPHPPHQPTRHLRRNSAQRRRRPSASRSATASTGR